MHRQNFFGPRILIETTTLLKEYDNMSKRLFESEQFDVNSHTNSLSMFKIECEQILTLNNDNFAPSRRITVMKGRHSRLSKNLIKS